MFKKFLWIPYSFLITTSTFFLLMAAEPQPDLRRERVIYIDYLREVRRLDGCPFRRLVQIESVDRDIERYDEDSPGGWSLDGLTTITYDVEEKDPATKKWLRVGQATRAYYQSNGESAAADDYEEIAMSINAYNKEHLECNRRVKDLKKCLDEYIDHKKKNPRPDSPLMSDADRENVDPIV